MPGCSFPAYHRLKDAELDISIVHAESSQGNLLRYDRFCDNTRFLAL
jgi:hypothetical protein